MNFKKFKNYFKKDITKCYTIENSKNIYYTVEDLKDAYLKASQFYKKSFKPTLLKQGNLKLENNVLIWDLPTIVTCKNACQNCYAIKPERIYKNTRIMRAYHLAIVLMAMDNKRKYKFLLKYLQNEIKEHVKSYKMPVVRIHSAGDFFSKKYLQFWLQVILNNKACNFYTYSKILSNDEIDIINKIMSNFNIVKSLINGKFINFGNDDYLQKIKNILEKDKQNYYICKYGTKEDHETCMGTCTKCLKCSNVLFYQH